MCSAAWTIMSRMIRIDGRIGKIHSFCAMYSFRMSACTSKKMASRLLAEWILSMRATSFCSLASRSCRTETDSATDASCLVTLV